jgi:WD40 repeat protein
MLFSGGDETIQLWNVKTREYFTSFRGHSDKVLSLYTSPDGMTLVSSSGDGTIKLWDTVTGENLKTLHGHIGAVWSTVLVNNSTMLASGSSDGTIKLWDLKASKCVNTLLDRPYEGMIITRTIGLTESEKLTLKALGAIAT